MNTRKNRLHSRILNKALIISIVILLAACSDSKKIANDLDDYSNRLQSYTGIELLPEEASYTLSVPSKSVLKKNIDRVSINLREFYAFNDCSLNQLVAQRNTSLGKMQLPSGRYAYESELINALLACQQKYQQDEEKAKLRDKLTEWTMLKQQQLPLAWSNLITQSTETNMHFSGSSGYISGDSGDDFQGTKQALSFLVNSRNQHPVDISSLELHLKQMNDFPLLAKQWRTQLLLAQELDNISLLLGEYLKNNTCSTLKEEQSIEIMQNIFRIFFAERIQPVAGQLNRYHYGLSDLVEEIANTEQIPEAFSQYLRNHNSTNYDKYTHSMQSHISIWQQIFARCDASVAAIK